jgi:ABC-type nitrate/sulfonate/bicarbonate transport system substrate-binding protein
MRSSRIHLAAVGALALTVALISACSSNNSGGGGTSAQTSSTAASSPAGTSADTSASAGSSAVTSGSADAGGSSMSSAAPSSSGGSAAPTDVTLQLNWIKDATWAGSYVAQQNGYYAAAGLNVDVKTGGPNVDYMAQLSAGKALIAFAGFNDPATLNAKGGDFRVVGTMYQRSPIAIISKADSGITNPKALEGKRLGLATSALLNWKQFAQINKVDMSKVKVVNTDDGASALVSGQVDAYMGYATEAPSLLASKGVKSQNFLLQDFGFGYYVDVYAVRASDLKDAAKRDQIERLLMSDLQGQLAAIKDPTAAGKLTYQLFGKQLGLTEDSQVSNATAAVPFFCSATTKTHGIGYMAGDELKTAVDTINLINGSKLDEKGTGLVDMSLLDDIHQKDPSFGQIPSSVCQ